MLPIHETYVTELTTKKQPPSLTKASNINADDYFVIVRPRDYLSRHGLCQVTAHRIMSASPEKYRRVMTNIPNMKTLNMHNKDIKIAMIVNGFTFIYHLIRPWQLCDLWALCLWLQVEHTTNDHDNPLTHETLLFSLRISNTLDIWHIVT